MRRTVAALREARTARDLVAAAAAAEVATVANLVEEAAYDRTAQATLAEAFETAASERAAGAAAVLASAVLDAGRSLDTAACEAVVDAHSDQRSGKIVS